MLVKLPTEFLANVDTEIEESPKGTTIGIILQHRDTKIVVSGMIGTADAPNVFKRKLLQDLYQAVQTEKRIKRIEAKQATLPLMGPPLRVDNFRGRDRSYFSDPKRSLIW